MTQFDAEVALHAPEGPILVHLAEGGNQFPWAIHKGKVIIGPPDGTFTSDGTSLNSLEWRTDRFWVVEALDAKGEEVILTPTQYLEAVESAAAANPTTESEEPYYDEEEGPSFEEWDYTPGEW